MAVMTGKSLRAWQTKNRLTDRDAAAEIGLARNTFMKHRDDDSGRKELPRIVSLALSALNEGLG